MNTIKPATPLPWKKLPYIAGGRTLEQVAQDDAFELHTANAYPELVAALRGLSTWANENVTDPAITVPLNEARALLAKLGEGS